MLLLAGEHALTNREVGHRWRPPAAAFLEVTSFPVLSIKVLIDDSALSVFLLSFFSYSFQCFS